jgi:arginyl-tRNA--protein-N-Asp/Glu arginylyltransferase
MIYDEYQFEKVNPDSMDLLWKAGFRHFGTYFFRYSIGLLNGEYTEVLPLRINLTSFTLSKSQRKTVRKNSDTTVIIRDCFIDEEKEKLFSIHAKRFTENKPESVFNFLSPEDTATKPCELKEICVFVEDSLAAVSFLDLGEKASSSVYAMFHPDFANRRLGIYTLLLEIQYSIDRGMDYLYPGYAYRESSFYDYKKKFHPMEYFDWNGNWLPLNIEETSED